MLGININIVVYAAKIYDFWDVQEKVIIQQGSMENICLSIKLEKICFVIVNINNKVVAFGRKYLNCLKCVVVLILINKTSVKDAYRSVDKEISFTRLIIFEQVSFILLLYSDRRKKKIRREYRYYLHVKELPIKEDNYSDITRTLTNTTRKRSHFLAPKRSLASFVLRQDINLPTSGQGENIQIMS